MQTITAARLIVKANYEDTHDMNSISTETTKSQEKGYGCGKGNELGTLGLLVIWFHNI